MRMLLCHIPVDSCIVREHEVCDVPCSALVNGRAMPCRRPARHAGRQGQWQHLGSIGGGIQHLDELQASGTEVEIRIRVYCIHIHVTLIKVIPYGFSPLSLSLCLSSNFPGRHLSCISDTTCSWSQ